MSPLEASENVYSWNVFVRRASNRSSEFVVRFAFLNRVLRLRKSLRKIQIINCKPAQCLDLDLHKGNRHSNAESKQLHCVKKCLKNTNFIYFIVASVTIS